MLFSCSSALLHARPCHGSGRAESQHVFNLKPTFSRSSAASSYCCWARQALAASTHARTPSAAGKGKEPMREARWLGRLPMRSKA